MGEHYEAKWYVSVDDVVSTFRMYYEQVGGTETPQTARSAGVALMNAQLIPLRNLIGQGGRVEAIYTRKVEGDPIPAWMGNFEDAFGIATGDCLHAQQALLINLRNSEGLLKRSGRVFIPGIPDAAITAGIIDTTWAGNFIDPYLDTLIDIPAGGLDNWEGKLKVQRNQVDNVPLENPTYVEVDGVDYTDVLGTQHRRKGELRGFKAAPV